jgi:CofD-related protein of GAK system
MLRTQHQVTPGAPLHDELRTLHRASSAGAPELGPRILFFSGGTALRGLSRVLKRYTHRSVHLITPFDSGGSSAQLRHAFAMPAIGDLRSRILALADEGACGNRGIFDVFEHRLPRCSPAGELREELAALASDRHALLSGVPAPMRRTVQSLLAVFVARMPSDFDLRGANIGNLLLVGCFLRQSRDLESALALFSESLAVRGIVRPIVDVDLHLCAELLDRRRVLGQHRITGKESAPIDSPVRRLSLIRSLEDPSPATTAIGDKVRHEIERADLICYPMGSFYSSVIANLLPGGVGRAIAEAACPRVYIPNTGHDPEQSGMSLVDSLETLLAYVRADAGVDTPLSRVVNLVLVDRDPSNYAMRLELEQLERLGVRVISLELVTEASRPHADPRRLAEALLALSDPRRDDARVVAR